MLFLSWDLQLLWSKYEADYLWTLPKAFSNDKIGKTCLYIKVSGALMSHVLDIWEVVDRNSLRMCQLLLRFHYSVKTATDVIEILMVCHGILIKSLHYMSRCSNIGEEILILQSVIWPRFRLAASYFYYNKRCVGTWSLCWYKFLSQSALHGDLLTTYRIRFLCSLAQ